jgi:DNA-binding NarL/FixJ family response regulator
VASTLVPDLADPRLAAPAAEAASRGSGDFRIVIAHDHDVIRLGFRLMFGVLQWVECCVGVKTFEQAQAAWRRYEPDVALVGLEFAGRSGLELSRALREDGLSGKVLLMSQGRGVSSQVAAEAGASGFLPTGLSKGRLITAVREVGRGGTLLHPPPVPAQELTCREAEVLELIASGATNVEIGGELHLSPNTVKGHTRSLYRKLNARNRAEAVQRAQIRGMLA